MDRRDSNFFDLAVMVRSCSVIEESMMLIQDQLAQSEAAIGRLPPGVKIAQSLRDYLIAEIQLSSIPVMVQRVCVFFDADRDLRVLWVLGALAMFDRATCAKLVALAESRGTLRSWWASPTPMLSAVDTRALRKASDAALAPDDKWTIDRPVLVQTKPDGMLDIDALPEGDLLRTAPRAMPLGRVS
jgi:hypothetical protein